MLKSILLNFSLQNHSKWQSLTPEKDWNEKERRRDNKLGSSVEWESNNYMSCSIIYWFYVLLNFITFILFYVISMCLAGPNGNFLLFFVSGSFIGFIVPHRHLPALHRWCHKTLRWFWARHGPHNDLPDLWFCPAPYHNQIYARSINK